MHLTQTRTLSTQVELPVVFHVVESQDRIKPKYRKTLVSIGVTAKLFTILITDYQKRIFSLDKAFCKERKRYSIQIINNQILKT